MGEFFGIDSQVEPLIFWLKDQINRPRPYQLARSYDLPLRPLIHTDAMSASYPSGHAATAYLMSGYLGRKYPEHKTELDELGKRIAESRENTGIHFPSDTKISRVIVDMIFDNNLLLER
jgi:membrane-associated phospholipid phosphatase